MSNISPGKGKHLSSRSHGHTYTHTLMCLSPLRATAMSGAWHCLVRGCRWTAGVLARKAQENGASGVIINSHRCWCQRVIWAAQTHKPPAACGVVISLRAPPCEGIITAGQEPFICVDKSITKSSHKASQRAHVWNKMHIFNKKGQELLAWLLRGALRGRSSLPLWSTVNVLI